jgi:hypothetical protein
LEISEEISEVEKAKLIFSGWYQKFGFHGKSEEKCAEATLNLEQRVKKMLTDLTDFTVQFPEYFKMLILKK